MHDKKQKKTNSRTELMMESGNEKRNRNKSRNQTEISNYGKRVREKICYRLKGYEHHEGYEHYEETWERSGSKIVNAFVYQATKEREIRKEN